MESVYFYADKDRKKWQVQGYYVNRFYDLSMVVGDHLAGRRFRRAMVEVPEFESLGDFMKFSAWIEHDLVCRFPPQLPASENIQFVQAELEQQ